MTNDRQADWENVYTTKGETEVSWFQETPATSLDLLALVGAKPCDSVIDIGGGASRLVDGLLAQAFERLTVLDLSSAALATARQRLGAPGSHVTWIVADATTWEPQRNAYKIWHDRAAFHFLTDERDQRAYLQRLRTGLMIGGYAIIGTFALDGPETCSGLPVARHSSDSLSALLGAAFALVDSLRHEHATPWGSTQKFQFSIFRKVS